MAETRLVFLYFIFLFSGTLAGVRADAGGSPEIQQLRSGGGDVSSDIRIELEQLKSKTQLLETRLEENNNQLKTKDAKISQLEKVIQEKSDTVSSLEGEIKAMHKKGISDVEERVGRAHARATELQKQIEKLKKESEGQSKEKVALEVWAKESEKKVEELSSNVDKLQKISDEQKTRILKTERALYISEEETMKAKLEVTSRTKELMNVHGAWLPPWFLDRLIRSGIFIEAKWHVHVRPFLEVLTHRALEKKRQAEKWAKPYVETIKTKWAPALNKQWLLVAEYIEPHLQALRAKTAEMYETSRTTIKPHTAKVHEWANPYYQQVKKFSKPYINQIATVFKPHLQKARTNLKPYTKKTIYVCGKFLEFATKYHHQVQVIVREKLKQHELTRTLATKELVWFAASALLALPVLISRVCSTIFSKNPKRLARSSQTHHTRRKGKRGYSDKC